MVQKKKSQALITYTIMTININGLEIVSYNRKKIVFLLNKTIDNEMCFCVNDLYGCFIYPQKLRYNLYNI